MPQPTDRKAVPAPQASLCQICCSEKPLSELLKPCHCGMLYCRSCLKQRFILASRDATLMPPSCCDAVIPIHFVIAHMSTVELSKFKAKFDEWRSPVKIYCPVPWCSTFIADTRLPQDKSHSSEPDPSNKSKTSSEKHITSHPSATISDNDAAGSSSQANTVHCPNCRARICIKCKQLCHPMSPCQDFVERRTRDVINKLGYKTCPSCGHGVRRMFGCNHMACVCGAHFCWGCRRPIGECEETEECHVEDEGNCTDIEDDWELERRVRLNSIVGDVVKRGEIDETFHSFCVVLVDLCIQNSDLYANPLWDTDQRRRDLLAALEAISDRATNDDYSTDDGHSTDDIPTHIVLEGHKLLEVLGPLARERPDVGQISDDESLQFLIDIVRSGIADSTDTYRETLIDLDRHDVMERDLDFGVEPTEPIRAFGTCEHRFKPYETPKKYEQGPVARDGMECHRCWERVRLKESEPVLGATSTNGVRYSLRSMSKAVAAPPSFTAVDKTAWSCVACRIMFCAGCADIAGVKLLD